MKENSDALHVESLIDESSTMEELRKCCPDLVKEDLVSRFILNLPKLYSIRFQNIVFSSIRQGMGDAVLKSAGYAFKAFTVLIVGLVIVIGIFHFWSCEKLLAINAELLVKEKKADFALEARRKELSSVEQKLAAISSQLEESTREYESLTQAYRRMSTAKNIFPIAGGGWSMELDSSNTFTMKEWHGKENVRFAIFPTPPLQGTAVKVVNEEYVAPKDAPKGRRRK